MTLRRNCADCTVGDRRHNLTERLDADIARRENALDVRLFLLVRDNVALLVQRDLLAEEPRVRDVAGKDENAEGLTLLCHIVLDPACDLVAEIGIGDHGLAADTLHHRIETNLDVRIVRKRVHRCLRSAELIAAHKDRDRLSIA